VPYAQYCLTFLPLFAILAASALVAAVRFFATRGTDHRQPRDWAAVATGLSVVVIAAQSLWMAKPAVIFPWLYPAIVCVALGVLVATRQHQLSDLSLTVLVMALCVLPAQWGGWMLAQGDSGQFRAIRAVLERTTADDIVLDGWSGYGAFRPHADYYWMFHPGVRAMLSPADVDRIVEGITSKRVRPKVVVLDDSLRAPTLAAFVEANYQQEERGVFVHPGD
jgi:hypothetical protein